MEQLRSIKYRKQEEGDNSSEAYDEDTVVFINLAQDLKEEGNKLFQRRDHEGAMMKYGKAIKLLPDNHNDISYLRSNIAACYMQMGHSEYPKAIHECDLALQVTPKYGKALLKRARCYSALNRLDLALKDVSDVLKTEPNNIVALEISEQVTQSLEEKGLRVVDDAAIELPPDYVESPRASFAKDKKRKKKSKKVAEQNDGDEIDEKVVDNVEKERNAEDKLVVNEKVSGSREETKKIVKLVFEEDIRCAQWPLNCSLLQLEEIVNDRFPCLGVVLIKYKDKEGDLVTVTTDEELRLAEASAESQGSFRLYLDNSEKKVQRRPFFSIKNGKINKSRLTENRSCCIESWIMEFAKLFRNHVGCESDEYLDLNNLGMKVYSEAMEDSVTSEEAQGLFETAAGKFQEMAALASFSWGNIHMSRARKVVYSKEDASRESALERIKASYDWARKEYSIAGQRYEASLRIKPDFYEGRLALGQQQFEQAKLSWYYALGNNTDLETWPSEEAVQFYNCAEDNMEKGIAMWEELESRRLKEVPNITECESQSRLNGLFEETSAEDVDKQAREFRSWINILWGTILYERSIMEFKLGLPVWKGCLDVAVEKFELAGASSADVALMLKSHVSNDDSVEGIEFRIDEIEQAWNAMNNAKKRHMGIPSFRLEPLLRHRVAKLYHSLETL